MLQTNQWAASLQGDRFISQRGLNEDAAMKFGTKMEIFSPEPRTQGQADDQQDPHQVNQPQNQQQRPESSASQEENRKTYTALLQNQVLGIDNPYLLHEIHNSDEICQKDNLYSFQMQRQGECDQDELLNATPEVHKRSSQFHNQGSDSSPFNSKFTVLKFNAKSPNTNRTPIPKYKSSSGGSGLLSSDVTPEKRGLFQNSTNYTPVSQFNHQAKPQANQFGLNYHQSPCYPSSGIRGLGDLLQSAGAPQISLMNFGGGLMAAPGIGQSPMTQSENFNPMGMGSSSGINSFSDFGGMTFGGQHPLTGLNEDQVIVPNKRSRKISKIPYKVLDAPALQDDFYLNLVDWSSTNNLAVGLSNCVYIWSASNSKVTKLHDLGQRDSVTSVCWSKRGSHLSIGTNSGVVQVWDINKQKLLRVLKGHEGRVGTIAWCNNVLSSGSKDKTILQRDLREKDDYFGSLQSHKQEVCGLKWSFDEQQLASGGNDNKLYVWSVHNSYEPVGKFGSHLAAVKAISWSPHQHGLLASGGGTADRCIRFWNTTQMQEINAIETGSQVCNLVFSKNVNEIVSTHGYSDNAIVVWKYPSMKKVATLTGHSMRVLYLAMSPDGENIVTGAGDETLRFWKVFPPASQPAIEAKAQSMIDPQSFSIR